MKQENIFLVDRSFSMSQEDGTPLEDMKRTLQLVLQYLPEACDFNFVDFGSTHRRLFLRSMKAEQKNKQQAWKHIQSIQGNYGGTFLFDALKSVFLLGPGCTDTADSGVLRNVFVFTDGHITDPEPTLDLIRKHAHHTRVFTFGLGESCNRHFVKAMARLVSMALGS